MTSLKINWGNKLEKLADSMFDSLYGQNWEDPMLPRCIVTNSPVMQAWLRHYFVFEWSPRQEKSRVLANCEFHQFYQFVNDWMDKLLGGYDNVAGRRRDAGSHPYAVINLQWRIYNLLGSDQLDCEVFKDINSYLGSSAPQRRFQLAGKLASIFDDYQMYRYDVVMGWENGVDVNDWQGELWNLLIEDDKNSYASLFKKINNAVSEEVLKNSFKEKYNQVALFGLTSMSQPYLSFLDLVMSKVVDIDLFVLNPEKDYWFNDVSAGKHEKTREKLFLKSPEYIDDPLALPTQGHDLLCSMGESLQDYLLTISEVCGSGSGEETFFDESTEKGLLGNLQIEILNFNPDDKLPKIALAKNDDSIQVHICHSARREVEVLHNYLLEWLTNDKVAEKRLQPYQIQVLVSDISTYAPHIDAIFNSPANHSVKDVPYVIDGRVTASDSEMFRSFMSICKIVTSRFELSSIVELLSNEAVRNAFDLTDEDINIVEQIVHHGNIRWGFNCEHRNETAGVDMKPYMTWEYGLDALLMGYATGEISWHDDLYSNDYAEGSYAVVLGKLTKFIYQLKSVMDSINANEEQTLKEWSAFLVEGILDQFFVTTETRYQYIKHIRKEVYALESLAENTRLAENKIPFDVIVDHLETAISGNMSGDSLSPNAVVFCQLRPMNSRPSEITCLLGLNDGDIPRNDNRPTFDRLAKTRRMGDRSSRRDDRGAFLEALINARRRFYLSYTGRTDKSNEVVPPSILVQELRDYLANRYKLEQGKAFDGSAVLSFETLHHMNAIHPDYFAGDECSFFSYSQPDLQAAKQLKNKGTNKEMVADKGENLETEPPKEVDLDFLKAFFVNPAKHYYKNIVGARLDLEESLLPDDDEPMESDSLESYKLKNKLGEELVNKDISEDEFSHITNTAEVEGCIPLGDAGKKEINEVRAHIEKWFDESFAVDDRVFSIREALKKRLNVDEKAATLVEDVSEEEITILGSYRCFHLDSVDQGALNIQLESRPAIIKTKDRIRAWFSHLFLCAQPKIKPTYTVILGMDKGSPCLEYFEPIEEKEAKSILKDLLHLYCKGQSDPLTFTPETSEAYFRSLENGDALDNPTEGQLLRAQQAAAETWGDRSDRYGDRSESMDSSMFHAFEEAGPGFSGSDVNQDFGKVAIAVFKPMSEAYVNPKKKRTKS